MMRMRSNCPECGSSLTIKEAVQNRCCNCGPSMAKVSASPRFLKAPLHLSLAKKNFDRLIAAELRKINLPPAA
jgi:DNA-directed RNA polymerase subunit M/transcription elongation factor TFIIS